MAEADKEYVTFGELAGIPLPSTRERVLIYSLCALTFMGAAWALPIAQRRFCDEAAKIVENTGGANSPFKLGGRPCCFISYRP